MRGRGEFEVQTHGRWAAAALVLLPFLLLLIGSSSAEAGSASAQTLHAKEVAAYRAANGGSRAIAEERVAVQHRGRAVVGRLRHALGSAYAGVWFDPRKGKFIVPLVPRSSRSAAAARMRALGLGSDYQVDPVRFSWATLEAEQHQVDARVAGLIRDRSLDPASVRTALDPETNQVRVEFARSVSSRERSLLEVLTQKHEAVGLKESERQSLLIRPLSCSNSYCNKPLRGGVEIGNWEAGYTGCTAGFRALGNNGKRYLLTAGHCVKEGQNPPLWVWSTRDPDTNQESQVGVAEQWQALGDGDWAKINATGTAWDTASWPAELVWWKGSLETKTAYNQEQPITAEASSYVGETVCHSGASSGTSCGSVTDLNVTTTSPEGTNYGSTEVQGPTLCAIEGDSGGPVFAGASALGLALGKLGFFCGEIELFYTEIKKATAALGVKVAPITPMSSQTALTLSHPSEGVVRASGTVRHESVPVQGSVNVNFYRLENGEWVLRNSLPAAVSNGAYQAPDINISEGTWRVRTSFPGTEMFSASESGDAMITPPTVEAKPASEIQESEATLNGTVNPNGKASTYHFEYGRTTSYGTSVPIPEGSAGSGSASVAESATITGLAPGTIYHYRISAHNVDGTSRSGDQQLKTLTAKPAEVIDSTGVTHMYYRGQNNVLQEYTQNGSTWRHSEWGGAVMGGAPTAVLGSEGKIWVYFRTTSGQLGSWWIQGVNGNYEAVGNSVMAGDPSAFQGSEGKRWVYFRTTSGQLGTWWFQGTNWNYEAVGTSVMAGDPSAFQGPEGKRWVYLRTTNGQLGTWWFQGTNWNYEGVGYSSLLGGDPTAIVTASGKREVFYLNPQSSAFHWWFQDPNWNLEALQSPRVNYHPKPAEVIDSTGVTHMYYRGQNNVLQEYYQEGSTWKHREWGTAVTAGDPTAVLGSEGKIWVYFRTTSGQLGTWWFQGTNWNYEAVGTSVMAGDPSALQGSEGKRWVYFRTTSGQLGTWWFQGTNWNYEAVGYPNVAGDPSAFQGPEGKRWVYLRTTNGQLGSWWFQGINLNYEALGYANTVAGDPSALQGSEGKRWVYFRTTSGQLGTWWFQGANGNYEAVGTSVMAGDPSAFQGPEGKRWVYLRTTNGQLGTWWFQGANWNYEGVGFAGMAGADPTAIVTAAGKREVFYFDPEGYGFHWWFLGPNWNLEGFPG